MISFDLNWLAVLAAVVANMVVGAVWFGVFAKPWMEGIGKTREQIQSNQGFAPYAVAILNSLVGAVALANVMSWMGADTAVGGLLAGLVMWVGFSGFAMASNHAFEGRSLKLWGINSGSYLVGLMVMGLIFGVWS